MSCSSISAASCCERCVTSTEAAAAVEVASDAMGRVREGDRAPAPNCAAAAKKARARRGGGERRGWELGFWRVGQSEGTTEGAAVVGAEKAERKNGIARVVAVVARPDLLRILDAAFSIRRWR